MKTTEIKEQVISGKYDALIEDLYADPSLLDYQKQRYAAALDKYQTLFGDDEVSIYSAAGRSEISGNHTDHQHGCVLAGSINLDAIGIVSKQDNVIKVISDDFDIKPIDLNDLDKKEDELGTSEALIRGVVSKLKELGYNVGGFKAFITSDVLMGAGLSSSAAFESIIGTIIDGLYNDMKIDMVTIAKVGQYAENVYFGKPCGLMDQCACAVGGLISIDFKDTSNPIVNSVNVDFSKYDHSLCIVDTKGSHADLTDAYGAVPQEMKEVAHYFGKEVLREVDEDEFYANIANLRTALNNDRAILRAIHFFNENRRVNTCVERLNKDDFEGFKTLIQESGNSSYKFLQTVYESGVVPNYTTNGVILSYWDKPGSKYYSRANEILSYTSLYCGGVAVSFGNKALRKYATSAIKGLLEKGRCKVNIHHIISDKQSVDEFFEIYNSYLIDNPNYCIDTTDISKFDDRKKVSLIYNHVLLPLMKHGRSDHGLDEGTWEYLESKLLEKMYDNISFGAHFIKYLENSEIKTWLYPAESLSKNIILEKDCVKITPSSFDLNPIKIINL